jgi:hypothetical protein
MRVSWFFPFASAAIDTASDQPYVVIEHIRNKIKPRIAACSRSKKKPAGRSRRGLRDFSTMRLCQ